MPPKSKKQFKWAHAAYARGQISEKVKDDYTHGVDYHKLPLRVRRKKKKRARSVNEVLARRSAQLRGR